MAAKSKKRSAKRGAGAPAGENAVSGGTRRRVGVRTHGGAGAMHVPMSTMRGASAKAAAPEATTSPNVQPERQTPSTRAATPGTGSSRTTTRRGPVAPVRELLADARELLSVARRSGRKLVSIGMDRRFLAELPRRIELVDKAERAWERQRLRTLPSSLRATREEAAELKTDLLAAGRYLLRNDAVAQRQLDLIAQGEGIDDLVSDLRALAKFWSNRTTMLAQSDLPDDAIERARALAARLDLSNRGTKLQEDEAAHKAREHRNRALTLLDEAVREVRAAGRYVFRDSPERFTVFRYEFKHAKPRHGE